MKKTNKQAHRAVVYEKILNHSNRFDEIGQAIHYKEFFKKHPNIEFVKVYADNGTESKLYKEGSQLQQIFCDAELGDFDLIITNSWDCISPYIADVCHFIDKALKLPKPVGFFFEAENICTFDSDYQTSLSFDAMVRQAQEEKHKRILKENHRIDLIRAKDGTRIPLGITSFQEEVPQ